MRYNTIKTLRIFWDHARKMRLSLALIYIGVIGATATGTIVPLYFKKFFDAITGPGTRAEISTQLFAVLGTVAILEVIRWTLWRMAYYFNTLFVTTMMADISKTCFSYIHKHSFAYFNNNFVGSLVKRFNWFNRAFESVHDKIVWNIVPLMVDIGVTIAVLWQRHFLLAAGLIVWLVIFIAVNWFFTRYKMKFDVERNEAESEATAHLADTITNHSNVKLFVGYNREVASYNAANDKVRRLRRFTWNMDSIFDAVQGLLIVVLELGMFYGALTLWQQGLVTVGDFVLIQTYVIVIFNGIWGFGRIFRYLFSDLADAEEMTVLLTTPNEIRDAVNAKELQVTHGEIAFKDVQFNYHATRQVINNLLFTIRGKEKVALIGPSGAGKSTIVKLILRMYELTSGHIEIDGQKIDQVTQESLWKNISMVPQDPILFHRSLMENIRYGKPDATDEEVFAAAKLAHCDEFINDFPEKYSTFVGERGVKLSGGERQRVAIARAILRNAPILVLDEATSSLDSESESLIQDALAHLMKDKTVIVIAHRLSTIMKMDRIIVIDRGMITEEGSHKELLGRTNGLYQQLWKLQAGGFMPDMPAENPIEQTAHRIPPELL